MKHLKLLLVIIGLLALADAPAATSDYDLHQAVLDNDLQLVKRLLSKGKAIDVIGSRKYGYGSALHLAVREGHVEIAQVLIDRGAQVDVLDPDDFTPLHNAAWNGNLEMTQLLLEAGADINASTYDGDTPLKLAQNNDQAQVAEFIQVKLQAPSGVATKVESTSVRDSDVIDVSGAYLVDVSGEPKFIKYILNGVRLEDRPVFELVQKGDQITVTTSGAESAGYRPIFASLDGNTVNLRWWDARARMIVIPGGKELVGTVVYTGGDDIKHNAELKLTKIDISGTYLSEVTGPYRTNMGLTGANPEVNLVQEGSKVTGTFESGGKLWGDVSGDSIELDYFLNGYQGKVSWKVIPGSNEVVGTWAYKETTGKDGNWNLTKIESDVARAPDISGTYIAETTASGSGMNYQLIKAFEKLNGKSIVLEQTGNTITGSTKSQSDWFPGAREIKGTREGNIISFYIIKGNEIIGTWEINADATNLEGEWFTNGAGGASGKWNLKRAK